MIKTMAIEISEDTYPIAVACLPGAFALIRKELVLGAFLVINDLQFPDYDPLHEIDEDEPDYRPRRARYSQLRPGYNNLTLTNFWSPAEAFHKDFIILTKGRRNPLQFVEVTRK